MFASWLVLLLFVNLHRTISSTHGVCEPIRIEMCRGVGYNVTAMPNLVGNEIQGEADFTLQTFSPLIQYGCSAQLHLFLCSVYAPMCTEKVPSPIGPCRGLCDQVKAKCYPVLLGFGFPWPAALNCSKFPPENNHQHMCMEGPGEPGVPSAGSSVQTIGDGNGPLGCSWYAKPGLYVFLNRSGRCAATCDADVLWSKEDKRLTEAWITAAATVCLISVAAAILALLKPYKKRVATSVERAIACLAFCHAAVAVGYIIRLVAGRYSVACTPAVPLHPQEQTLVIAQQQHQYLTQDGLSNPYCALVFLLRYYFSNAASVWWVVVCGWWCIAARKWTRYYNSNNNHLSGNNGNRSEDGFGLQQGCATVCTVASWGLPAVHTIAVLITRDVDADELTGSCFVGQQNTRSLLILVLGPQLVYLIFGLLFLIIGTSTLIILPRRRSLIVSNTQLSSVLNPLNPSNNTLNCNRQQRNNISSKIPVIESQAKQKMVLIRVGIFATVYSIVVIFITSVTFYEWFSRDSWLSAPQPSSSPKPPSKPIIQLFILRYVVSLAAGVMAAAWIWWPNVVNIWRRLPPCKQPPHKCHPHGVVNAANNVSNAVIGNNTNANANSVVRCYSTGSTSPTPHQTHHLNHLAPQHPLLRPPIVNNSGQQLQSHSRGYKKHRKHRKHHSGSETQV